MTQYNYTLLFLYYDKCINNIILVAYIYILQNLVWSSDDMAWDMCVSETINLGFIYSSLYSLDSVHGCNIQDHFLLSHSFFLLFFSCLSEFQLTNLYSIFLLHSLWDQHMHAMTLWFSCVTLQHNLILIGNDIITIPIQT